MRTSERDKYIGNFLQRRGQFYRKFKTKSHPHTNMTKATLT